MNNSLVQATQGNLQQQDIECRYCGILTPYSGFIKAKKCPNGIARMCKICSNKKKVDYYNRTTKITKDFSWKKNPELHAEYCKKWRDLNKDVLRFHSSYRRKGIKQALPCWENLDELKLFYKNCPIGYHVDHIIPLNNPNVCGLHTIPNLQYLLAIDNLRKGNSYYAESRNDGAASGQSATTGY
jgi:hypothetical protein